MGIPEFISNLYRTAGKFDPVKAATSAGLGALAYGALKPDSGIGEFITGKKQQPVGYTGGIPEYGVNRTLLPDAFATTTPTGEPRRPGSGGRRYFSDMTYTPTGNTMSAAINPVNVPVTTRAPAGVFDGLSAEEAQYFFNKLFSGQGISNLGDDTEGLAQGGLASLPQSQGYYLGGTTDGMADRIPANINGSQPAALSDGEFVMPADVVSHLGNGNSDAGAKVLYSMMDRVRQARTGTKEQGRKITPNKFTPV